MNRTNFSALKKLVILIAVKSSGPFGYISEGSLSQSLRSRKRAYFRRLRYGGFLQVRATAAVLHRNKVSEFKLERICRIPCPFVSFEGACEAVYAASHGYK